jgi:hypothetical protein
MPPHPFNASLCHVIEAGLKNIRRLNKEGRAADVAIEVEHLIEVESILNRYCLYYGTPRYDDAAFDRYWRENRLAYKAKIDAASLENMMHAWDFLAPDHEAFDEAEGEPFWVEWRKRNAKPAGPT